MINIIRSKQSLTDSDLQVLNNLIVTPLPMNYRTFIMKYNGGLVKDDDTINTILSVKFGELTVENMISTHTISEKNLPAYLLPIALDWSSNPICIDLRKGMTYGNIILFYLDVDSEYEVIADDLEEFLKVGSIDNI
jgi:hypothetical protein